jgi:hypothetical protein
MEALPLDLQASIFEHLDDRDRNSLFLASPVSLIDAYKVCPRIAFLLQNDVAVEQAVSNFKSLGGTKRVTIESDGLYHICHFLAQVQPVRLTELNIHVRNFTAYDALHYTDVLWGMEGHIESINILLGTDEDDFSTFTVKTSPLTTATCSFRVQYLLGAISAASDALLPSARSVELSADSVARSIWDMHCPRIRRLKVRGGIARCRQTRVGSERLLANASLETMEIDVENQVACDLLIYVLRNAVAVNTLVVRYSMPLCIYRGVPSVKNLRLYSVFNMPLDIVYPRLVDQWTLLESITLVKGMQQHYSCLFALRFLDTAGISIQDVMRSLADRWVFDIPDDVSLEIERV